MPMPIVPIEVTIAELATKINCWQHLLIGCTASAAVFGIIAAVVEIWQQQKFRLYKIVFGIVSGVFWVFTVACAHQLNTYSAQLQKIYADQTSDAERRVIELEPTVTSIDGQVKSLKPDVQLIDGQMKMLRPEVKSALDGLKAAFRNENEIRDFHVEVSYQVGFGRGSSSATIALPYNPEGGSPEIRCDGLTLSLEGETRTTSGAGEDKHTDLIVYRLLKPEQLEGKPINALDSCHILAIPIMKLGLEEANATIFYSIPYLDMRFVINGFPLSTSRIITPKSFWMPRVEDAGSVTFLVNTTSSPLSRQYIQRHNR